MKENTKDLNIVTDITDDKEILAKPNTAAAAMANDSNVGEFKIKELLKDS